MQGRQKLLSHLLVRAVYHAPHLLFAATFEDDLDFIRRLSTMVPKAGKAFGTKIDNLQPYHIREFDLLVFGPRQDDCPAFPVNNHPWSLDPTTHTPNAVNGENRYD